MIKTVGTLLLISAFAVSFQNSGFSQILFKERLIDDNTRGTGGLHLSDIDGDGDLDLLAASLEDNQILWFRNDGGKPPAWKKIVIGENVGSAHSVFAADFDGDGALDVLGAAYIGSPGIAWWRNVPGDPVTWKKYAIADGFANAHEVFACDLDGDKDIDVLGASSDGNEIAWWRNDGGTPVAWTKQVLSGNVLLAKSVHVGDFNGDRALDVVGASIADRKIRWWQNMGGSPLLWMEHTVTDDFAGAHRVQAVDLDGDGDDDILGTAYLGHEIAWWRNDGGDPVAWTKEKIGTGLTNACVGLAVDLDNDADLDVIGTVQGKDQVVWWRNEGIDDQDIVWEKNILTESFTRPWPVCAGDVDGDGDVDIVAGSSHRGSHQVKWWENRRIRPAE